MAVTFIGGTEPDTIHGNSAQGDTNGDSLYGGGGSDSLTGGDGNDVIAAGGAPTGTAGANGGPMTFAPNGTGTTTSDSPTLQGGAGADSIFGGAGHGAIFGDMGNDTITSGTGYPTIYGGANDDTIDVTRVTAGHAVFVSGDLGNDVITLGRGLDTVLGGDGQDTITSAATAVVNGANPSATDMLLLFGNAGNDSINAASAGGESLFGGQGNDVVIIGADVNDSTVSHYAFGNLGNDVISLTGSGSIYGGQGEDTIGGGTFTITGTGNGTGSYAATTFVADTTTSSHYLSGDLGNDVIFAGQYNDTIIGGGGRDVVTLGTGTGANGGVASKDTIIIHAGDSTAAQVSTTVTNGSGQTQTTMSGSEVNLDRYTNFVHNGANGQNDTILLANHNSLVLASPTANSNLTNYTDTTATYTTEGQAFQAAYLYAYGDGTANHVSHFTTEYLAVASTYTGAPANGTTYVFTQDHAAFALDGFAAGTLSSNAIITGA